MSWTTERIERLKVLWPNNRVTAAGIAQILNREFAGDALTRNAAIGKAMRLKLPFRRAAKPASVSGSPTRNGGKVVFDFRVKPKHGHANGAAHTNGAAKVIDLPAFPFRGSDRPSSMPPPADDDDASHARDAESNGHAAELSTLDFTAAIGAVKSRCTLFELTADTCRWPMGDPATPQFFFCGTMPALGRPYCSFHCRMAYQRR